MSGLLFLTSEDFYIGRGSKGPILCNKINHGFSLILFYSTQCVPCQNLIPIFKRLPGTIAGCQFGMIKVGPSTPAVLMSKETIAPIDYVPYILFFVHGKPFMKYNGPHDPNEIKRFVVEVANSITKNQKFSPEKVKDDTRGIPSYSSGVPLYGENKICYLKMLDAYTK